MMYISILALVTSIFIFVHKFKVHNGQEEDMLIFFVSTKLSNYRCLSNGEIEIYLVHGYFSFVKLHRTLCCTAKSEEIIIIQCDIFNCRLIC